MWISNFSIKNPVITTVLMLALVAFGALALLILETDEEKQRALEANARRAERLRARKDAWTSGRVRGTG